MRTGALLVSCLVLLGGCSRGMSVSVEGVDLVVVEFDHLVFDRGALESAVGAVETGSVAYVPAAAGELLASDADTLQTGTSWTLPMRYIPGRLALPPDPRGDQYIKPPSPWPVEAQVSCVWLRGTRTEAEVSCYGGPLGLEPRQRLLVSLLEGEHAVVPLVVERYEVMALVVRAQ